MDQTPSKSTTSSPPDPRSELEEVELHRARRVRGPLQRGRRSHVGRERRPTGAVDPERARVVEDLEVERAKPRAVVEVAQVRELVTERVHEARILERPVGGGVAQPDLDRAVRVADAITAAHTRALCSDRAVTQLEAAREPLGVEVESLDQTLCRGAIHVRPILPATRGVVNAALARRGLVTSARERGRAAADLSALERRAVPTREDAAAPVR